MWSCLPLTQPKCQELFPAYLIRCHFRESSTIDSVDKTVVGSAASCHLCMHFCLANVFDRQFRCSCCCRRHRNSIDCRFYCRQFPVVRVFPKDLCHLGLMSWPKQEIYVEFESQMLPTNFTYIFRFNVKFEHEAGRRMVLIDAVVLRMLLLYFRMIVFRRSLRSALYASKRIILWFKIGFNFV